MRGRSVAFFSMPEEGHLRRMLPVVAGIARRGLPAHVFAHASHRDLVERAGGRFVDLFGRRPLDAVDATSSPVPCRYVSFAGVHAGDVADEVAALGATLVVYDTFAVVGRVVAARLGLPYVNVCAGHAVDPARFLSDLATDPRVSVSPACRAAVETLRTRHGLEDATPFSYVSAPSPTLNLYGEPREWLTDEERHAFEPVAFFGSISPEDDVRRAAPRPGERPFVYVCLGTVGWRYYAPEMRAALIAVADAFATLDVSVVVSLGRRDPDPALAGALRRDNVAVVARADQRALLARADAFVTHHGLNSTHEAVWHRVPMLSWPVFWDQPALAARAQAFGLAVRLAPEPRTPPDAGAVRDAYAEVVRRRAEMEARLAEARGWERAAIEGRGAVLDRLAALA